jgi:hypothetical protein
MLLVTKVWGSFFKIDNLTIYKHYYYKDLKLFIIYFNTLIGNHSKNLDLLILVYLILFKVYKKLLQRILHCHH